MKKLIAFDLDGTLADSKQPVPDEIINMLCQLMVNKYDVAVISGCSYEQMNMQLDKKLYERGIQLSLAEGKSFISRAWFLPTSGSQIYTQFGDCIFKDSLTLREKVQIWLQWDLNAFCYIPKKIYGEVEEDRDTQITFSMCGQDAPLEVKEKWDPDKSKRQHIISLMQPHLPDFEVKLGGTTSIDVTRAGIDKAFGIRKLMNMLDLTNKDVIFFGDKLNPGENDYPVKEMGIDCIEVENWQDTLEKVKIFYEQDRK